MNESHDGVVAAGSEITARAAIEILRGGGNAYDAVLAAYLTACVAEPGLTSLGGGGYLLAHTSQNKNLLYDFFVQTPRSKKTSKTVDFFSAIINFGPVKQEFHIGMGSVGVPGGVRGIFKIHNELCSLPLERIIQPAVRAARNGIEVNEFQAKILALLAPILTSTRESQAIYKSSAKKPTVITEGEIFYNIDFADFLERLIIEGDSCFYEGSIADKIVADMRAKGGYVSHKDLSTYKVEKRKPLSITYRGNKFITNPPPSSGGLLIAFALKMMESVSIAKFERDSPAFLKKLAEVMHITNIAREDHINGSIFDKTIAKKFLDAKFLKKYSKQIEGITNHMGSTTHISVIDNEGNVASMTTSNGEGSGYIIPGTGIMMNNMLGEEDLHPDGFHKWKENERISSMMAPSILIDKKGNSVAIGSGGSNRIRTAILQVLINYIDFGMTIEEAVEHPRIHFEKEKLNIEPTIDAKAVKDLKEEFPSITKHSSKGIYFGGVHTAVRSKKGEVHGAGDKRRGGIVKSL